ncbi:MAG: metallophosphoesterase [Bacteroidota bacterium]
MNTQLNDTTPIASYPYDSVIAFSRQKHYTKVLERIDLPIYSGSITGLDTSELDYLVLASDLQGTIQQNGETLLLGEVLPEFLQTVFTVELNYSDLNRVGVLLCGDLYARTDRRGGLGDVRHVWREFNKYFRFVAGVAGNHDDFGTPEERQAFTQEEGIHLLHYELAEIAGLRIGGISGIIGRPTKPNRNLEAEHLKELIYLLQKGPQLVLLHEGPNHLEPRLRGNDKVRQIIEQYSSSTVCCGHRHWDTTVITNGNGSQVINLDAKCAILRLE